MAEQTNPYMALLQQEEQAPSTAQLLRMFANLVGGASAGIGQTGTWGGVAPGLFMGINANAQDADQAEKRRLRQAEIGIQASKWDEERKQRQAQAAGLADWRKSLGGPGITAPQPPPYQLGPSAAGGPAPNQEAFVQMMMPHALEVSKQTGLDPRLVIAQSALETGYGRAAPGNNYFGIKSHGQSGGQVLPTNEVGPAGEQYTLNQSFRTYGDPAASAADYANFIKSNSRYAPVLSAQGLDAQIEAIGKSGYATDPNYAAKLRQIAGRIPGGPQVAQGGGGPTAPGGSPIDTSAPPPAFMGGPPAPPPGAPPSQGGGEGEIVPLQYALPPPSPSATPAPGGPVVPAQYRPPGPQQAPAGQPPLSPPLIPELSPQALPLEVRQRLATLPITTTSDAIKVTQEALKEHRQHLQTQAVEAWNRQWKEYDHARGRSEAEHDRLQKERTDEALRKAKRDQELQDEGQYVRGADGVEVWVPKGKLPGTTRHDKPADQYEVVSKQNAQMELGEAYDPKVAYQRNLTTKKLEPIRTGAETQVNIDQKGESEFAKKMGQHDAERFSEIIKAEGNLNDMASKLTYALGQFQQTYTGPGAEAANQLNRILGAAGFEKAGNKANAADAAMAAVSEMKPHMRAPGSGTSSDRDMDMYARALPSLMNLPGGNERIVGYFQRIADRATEVRRLAQEHSNNGKTPLTQTGFDDAVKKLGRLFNEDEIKELTDLGKSKPAPENRPPLSTFGTTPSMTPAPQGSIQPRPPIGSFGGGR